VAERSGVASLLMFGWLLLLDVCLTKYSFRLMNAANQPTNQPTKDLSEGVDLREAQIDVPLSV
jgi:hypothetical protein